MLPFTQRNTNQAPGASVPPQIVGGTTNLLPNLVQIQSQMGYVNPQISHNTPNFVNIPNFNTLQNAHLGTSIMGSSQQIQSHPGFLGFPVNGQLTNLVGQGNSTHFFGQNNNIDPLSNGQFGWQNQLQQLANSPLLNLNASQVNALTQLLGCAQAINPAFLGNSNLQLGFGQPYAGLPQANFSQQMPVASQQLQNVSVPPSNPAVLCHPHGQSNFQGNIGQKQGMHSSHHLNNNFKNSKREAFNGRFQKSHDRNLRNPKGKSKSFIVNDEKGINDGADSSSNQFKTGKRRSLTMLYTEKEIQQWREERKKNYPSKSNLVKKLAQKQASANEDEATKLRRQQLKDVLAKQVELGFEIPEIPSHYLLDPEHQDHGRDKSKMPLNEGRFQKNGRFQNRFSRGGKFDRRDRFASKRATEDDGSSKKHEQYAKRPRVENDNSPKTPFSIMEPTLLQKLLSNDIKRDKNRLLQAFRFMVINSFFKDYPGKPLNFPEVIVKEAGVDSDVTKEKSSSFLGELDNVIEDCDKFDDGDGENDDCQEEGEITD